MEWSFQEQVDLVDHTRLLGYNGNINEVFLQHLLYVVPGATLY